MHILLTCIYYWHAYISDMHVFLTRIYFWHAYNSHMYIILICTYFWKYMNVQKQYMKKKATIVHGITINKSNGLMIKWSNAKQHIRWVKKVKYFKERKEVMKLQILSFGKWYMSCWYVFDHKSCKCYDLTMKIQEQTYIKRQIIILKSSIFSGIVWGS